MPERSRLALWILAIVALALPPGGGGAAAAGAPAVSVRSGRWSDPATWARRAVPGPSLGVRIARGTVVEYDVHSDGDLGPIAVAGTLAFSSRRSTRMDAAGVIVEAGGVLQMGRPGQPIPAGVTAEIRLVIAEGQTFQGGDFVAGDVGIWVMRGGQWEVNGAPLRYTWAKLARTARAGDRTVLVAEDLSDWPAGGQLLITPTAAGPTAEAFEERALVGVRRV
ncbi:MAG TPA: G8 domain-containing protein, partial [bacterium]|nr:G8 domain-containing protein [bacterium]